MPVLTVDVDLEYDQDLIKEIQVLNGVPVNIAEYISEAVNDIIRADIDSIHSRNDKKAVDLIIRYNMESRLGYLLPRDTFAQAVHEICTEIINSPEMREKFRKRHDELDKEMVKDTLSEIARREDLAQLVRERMKGSAGHD